MLTSNGEKLQAIDDFRIDYDLPKHKKPKKNIDLVESFGEEDDDGEDDIASSRQFRMARSVIMSSNPRDVSTWAHFGVKETSETTPVPWYKKLLGTTKKAPDPELEPVMSIPEFFANVKNSAQELIIVNERAVGYEKALQNAKQMGQAALFERLSSGLVAFKAETQLIAMGLTKYVEEQDIVSFYKQSKKGLRLTWVKNFTRTVPESVMQKKVRADELGLFDNYVILHYDPEAKAFGETEKEKEARKDPILFGLMKDVTKLYFVGDWIDEHCDLTLEQLAETMGKDVIKSMAGLPHPYRGV